MARNPPSRKLHSSPLKVTKCLTNYFSPSPSPKKRTIIQIDQENNENGITKRRRPMSAGVATLTVPLEVDEHINMEKVTALIQIPDSRMKPRKLTFRAGDRDIIILRTGAMLGRLVNESSTTTRNVMKPNLNIRGAGCGVSRKHLHVKRTYPLVLKQLKTVTNSVSVWRYNPLTKSMSEKGWLVPKISDKDTEFSLKAGDVLEMDSCVRQNRQEPKYIFRVVDCFVPKSTGKRSLVKTSSPVKVVDLVATESQSSVEVEVVSPPEAMIPTDSRTQIKAIDLMQSTETAVTDEFRPITHRSTPISIDMEPMVEELKVDQSSRKVQKVPFKDTEVVCIPANTILSMTTGHKVQKIPFQETEVSFSPAENNRIATNSFVQQFPCRDARVDSGPKKIVHTTTSKVFQKSTKESAGVDSSPESKVQTTTSTVFLKSLKRNTRVDSSPERKARSNTSKAFLQSHDRDTKGGFIPEKKDRIAKSRSLLKFPERYQKEGLSLGKNDVSKGDKGSFQECISNVESPVAQSEAVPNIRTKTEECPPGVGDLVRVSAAFPDTFGQQRQSWWLGEVTKVTRESSKGSKPPYTLEVTLRDQAVLDFPFPSDIVHKLEKACDSNLLHALVPSELGVTKELAFDTNPESLSVGDLVEAYYQDGKENGRWYRGRVAAVDSVNNTCTIAYDDSDLEAGVPLGQGKITLVEKGETYSWLTRFPVWDDFQVRTQGSKRKIPIPKKEIGSVTNVEVDGNQTFVVVQHKTGRGRSVTARLEYSIFVNYVFESLSSRYINGPNEWPDTKRTSLSSNLEQKDYVAQKDALKKGVAGRKKVELFREEDWDISATEAIVHKQIDPDGMKEMNQFSSSSFFRALNSTDPVIGISLFSQMASCHNRGLNPGLGRNIRELIWNGPACEGTQFPDPHRIETTLSFIEGLLTLNGGNQNFLNLCSTHDWPSTQAMLESIVKPIYSYDGDAGSKNPIAWDRILASLHLIASKARFLAMLWKAELYEHASLKKPEVAKCRSGPLAKTMGSHPDGSRYAVKAVIKTLVRSLLRYGHHTLVDLSALNDTENVLFLGVARICRDEANRTFNYLGTVVSYVLWLYSVCEGIRLNNKDLAYIVSEVFESELNQSTIDPSFCSPTNTKKGKRGPLTYVNKLKLRLVMALDDEIIGPVATNLAKQFAVDKEYMSVVG